MMIQAAFSVRRVLAQDLLAARMHKGEAHAYEIADWSSSCRFCGRQNEAVAVWQTTWFPNTLHRVFTHMDAAMVEVRNAARGVRRFLYPRLTSLEERP